MRSRWLYAVAVAWVLLGCGHPELAIEPASTTVTAGASPLTFTASGGQGEYQWSLVPETLGTLSSTEGESITFTPAGIVSEETTGVLTVSSKEETASVELTVTPRGVSGVVVSPQGMPVTGVLVALAGPAGTFSTVPVDGEGRFSFASVPPVYDLVVADYTTDTFTVHRGLTRTDPTLIAMDAVDTVTDFSATVRGTVSGGAYPAPPAGHVTRVSLEGTAFNLNEFPQDDADGAGAYDVTADYFGVATTPVTAHALQFSQDADGRATAYAGYGKLENVGLANGATLLDKNIVLSPVPGTVNFTGTLAPPAGATLTQKSVFVQVGPAGILRVLGNTVDPLLDVPMPDLPGATATVVGSVSGPFGSSIVLRTGLPLNASGVTLTPPPAPQVLAPASGASDVTTATEFRWADAEDTTYLMMVDPLATGPKVVVITTEPRTTLPDLSGLGVRYPKSAGYDWLLLSFPGMADTDAFAEEGYVGWVYGHVARHTAGEVRFTQFQGTFTTAP